MSLFFLLSWLIVFILSTKLLFFYSLFFLISWLIVFILSTKNKFPKSTKSIYSPQRTNTIITCTYQKNILFILIIFQQGCYL